MSRRLLVVGALFVSAALAPEAFAVQKSVRVVNPAGALISGATVFGMVLGEKGPDAAKSVSAMTGSDGTASLALSADEFYHYFAFKHGFLPRLKEQVFNPEHPADVAKGTLAVSTITISSAGAAGLGEVVGNVSGATANSLVFASVQRASLDGTRSFEVNFGACSTDGAGACELFIVSVPTAASGAYQMGAFDPKNASGGECLPQPVTPALTELSRSSATLDFSACGIAARRSSGQRDLSQGEADVEGVVTDTTAAKTAIRFVNLSFDFLDPNVAGATQTVWTHADENGRFQLFGLISGVTYFANISGGCAGGACFQGWNSTRSGLGSPPGLNDFLFAGQRKIVRAQLSSLAAGDTQALAVYVSGSNGAPIPDAHLNIHPDWDGWETDGDNTCFNSFKQNPGGAQYNVRASTGYGVFSGLPSGNYRVYAWTQFSNESSQFNAGADGRYQHGNHCGSDDLRLTISTNPATIGVFNGSGTAVSAGISSITISVQTAQNQLGKLFGTLTFSEDVDLTADPVTILLRGSCGSSGCKPGGFAVVNSSDANSTGPDSYAYQAFVATGAVYELRVVSGFYGRAEGQGGDFHRVDFNSTGTVKVDMKFERAGKLSGILRKPDGSVFRPSHGTSFVGAWVSVGGDCGWSGAEVTDSGEFTVGGLLPCEYKLEVNGWGDFPYALPQPGPRVTIAARQLSSVELQLVAGVPVAVLVDTGALPSLSFRTQTGDQQPPESWVTQTFPPGTQFSQKNFHDLLRGEFGDRSFRFQPKYAGEGPCGSNWPGGFCPRRVAAGNYDFLLMRRGEFRPEGGADNFQYFTIVSSTKNISVKEAYATRSITLNGQAAKGVPVNPAPASSLALRGNHTLRGEAFATNIFRADDFAALGGSFDNFLRYIPTVAVYDSSDTLIAGGMITPRPASVTQSQGEQLDRAIADGNFSSFRSVMDSFGNFHYEIKGLAPAEKVSLVFATPNYPSIKKSVTLGVDKGTTTVNVDFDSNAGGKLSGVVRTTSSVALANAQVSLAGEAYVGRQKTTGSDGSFSFEGLAAGAYRLSALASGYSPKDTRVALAERESKSVSVALSAGGGAITGTVYKDRFPFPKFASGAELLCYDETFAGNNTLSEVTLYKVRTSSAGFFRIENVLAGDSYRCAAKLQGKFVLTQSTTAIAGTLTGFDFYPTDKPPRLAAACRANDSTQKVECKVSNPSDFSTGAAFFHASTQTFTKSLHRAISDVGDNGDNTLTIRIRYSALGDDVPYTLHMEAVTQSAGETVFRNLPFSKRQKDGGSEQDIDEALLGDSTEEETGKRPNEVCMNSESGNGSCMSIPVGAMLSISSGVIPALSFGSTELGAATVAAKVGVVSSDAFLSDVYELSVASINFTGRGVDLCLGYGQSASDLSDLALHLFNETRKRWEPVSGQQTINPLKGTVCTRVSDLTGAAPSAFGGEAGPMRAAFDGKQYQIRTQAGGGSGSGTFAILKPSLTSGDLYAGAAYKAFNFPNPFDLRIKTVSVVHGGAVASLDTSGTVIKVEVPSSGGAGEASIRIYNLAGELVRELNLGPITGGRYYYHTWDGRNVDGEEVANGVYYGVVHAPGGKAKDVTFKMAVIK